MDALRSHNRCYFEVTCCSGRCVENKKAAGVIYVCISGLRVSVVRNEMMDGDSSFLATDFGWWWLLLWVGLILDQEVGSRVDWAVQEGDLMRKHRLTSHSRVTFPQCTQRVERILQEGRLMQTNDLKE